MAILDNLSEEVKHGTYVINPDEYSDIRTDWISLHVLNNKVIYFYSVVPEHIPKEIKTIIHKSIAVTNIFRIQAYDSITCGYFVSDLLIIYLKARI